MSVIQRIPFDGFPLPNYSGFHITEFYAVARGREVGIFPSWYVFVNLFYRDV